MLIFRSITRTAARCRFGCVTHATTHVSTSMFSLIKEALRNLSYCVDFGGPCGQKRYNFHHNNTKYNFENKII